MTQISTDEIRNFIIKILENTLILNGLTKDDISDDFDLFEQGIIDSLGIIELITEIENHFGLNIDFENIDPEEITIIGPFCKYIAENATNQNSIKEN